ncbi:MAG TPA: diguanylate cyclase [Gaiellaceae bacterium]|jgi:GGDEF domain-containing protein|nr:diguanylate cyclase [Gaiellaceae bacterium]
MFGLEDVTAWTAVGTSAFAALLVLLGIVIAVRWRRGSERRLRTVQESATRSEEMLAELTGNLERLMSESEVAREQGERTEHEARRLRVLGELGVTLELDDVAHRALEHATREVDADGAILALERDGEGPYTAAYGLSPAESERELGGLPPSVNDARAVAIRFRYTAEEVENDAFCLSAGLAVPLQGAEGIGTLAVFWRRTPHDPGDSDIDRLEGVAALLAAPLDNARRYEEARRLADLDPVTGLQNERYFVDRLLREVARARRYERRLALLVFRLDGAAATIDDAASFGRRLRGAIRSADVPCHLGGGEFAVIAPEAALSDAERLAERMRFAAAARPQARLGWLGLGIAELGESDSAGSCLDRARAAARAEEPAAPVASATRGGR